MKAATYHGPGDIRIEERAGPEVEQSTDAIVRITHTEICGSDLWPSRGADEYDDGTPVGHEPMGIGEEIGADISQNLSTLMSTTTQKQFKDF